MRRLKSVRKRSYEINTLDILKNLAIILVAAKLLGIVARKLGAPQVVGEIIAGLIVGPCMLNFVSYDGFISGWLKSALFC